MEILQSNNIHNNIKKDGDSSSNSSLASNQTGKFKFKRDKANSIDNNKQIINNININNKIEEKENIIDNNQDEKDTTTNIKDKEQNNNILNNDNKDLENNTLLKSIYDELEFINIRKSIQYHDNQTNEEIETNLSKQKINKSKPKNENNLFTLNNLLEDEINEDDKNENNINKYIKNNLLNEKEFCVQKLEENIKYIKFFSRKNYEEIRDKNKRKLMYVMIGIMIVIFIFYLIGNKYSDSINRLIKVLMTPRE